MLVDDNNIASTTKIRDNYAPKIMLTYDVENFVTFFHMRNETTVEFNLKFCRCSTIMIFRELKLKYRIYIYFF